MQYIKNMLKDLIQHLKKVKSFKLTGEELRISLSTVIRYFKKLKISEKKKSTKVIHFDEFKGNADKEKYQLQLRISPNVEYFFDPTS